MAANDELKGWFAGRIPKDWFQSTPEVRADRDEIWVVVALADVQLPGDAGPEAANAARSGRIKQHREDTRDMRMQISEEAEKRFGPSRSARPVVRSVANKYDVNSDVDRSPAPRSSSRNSAETRGIRGAWSEYVKPNATALSVNRATAVRIVPTLRECRPGPIAFHQAL